MNYFAKFTKIGAAVMLIVCSTNAQAQLNPMGAMFFQNQYISNPAMAGADSGLVANLGMRQQWSAVPGAPTTQSVTAEYGSGGKVGLGFNLDNDKAGLMKRTRVMGTYAYHLPLGNENQTVNFGVSFGFMSQRIESSMIDGDAGDASVGRYNNRETYLDGDFGVAYKSNNLTIQGAVPNLKSFFKTDDGQAVADYATFITSIAYKIRFGSGQDAVSIEPKADMRGVRGYKNIFDAGANLLLANEQLIFQALYHSTKSATVGLGINYKRKFSLLGIYTTETAALRTYASGNFEVGLRVKAF